MNLWTEADEMILVIELYVEPDPQPLPAWQRHLLGRLFPGPVSMGPEGP